MGRTTGAAGTQGCECSVSPGCLRRPTDSASPPEQEGQGVVEPGAPRRLVVGSAVVLTDDEIAALDQPLPQEPGAHRRVSRPVSRVEPLAAAVDPVARSPGRP